VKGRDNSEVRSLIRRFGATGGGGAVPDGDYGDVSVSGGVWTVDAVAVANVTNLATTVQAYTLDTFANPVASLDFAQQQTLQFVIENRTSDPGSPVTGQIWLRTDL
jgi:hypothetical protein